MKREYEILLRESVRRLLAEARKPLAGFGATNPESPFGGSANGHASYIAEWAVYFAAKSPGDATEAEWKECQADTRYASAFQRASSLAEKEGPEGETAQNLLKLKSIFGAMKLLASDAVNSFGEFEMLPGKESEPKPGTDEVDVPVKGINIHVKLNDDHRIGGLGRGKLAKGQYLEGYISSDIYYRAVQRLVKKHVLDETTADEKYRSKIVDVPGPKGKAQTWVTTRPEASSNVVLGKTTLKLKQDSNGKPIIGKKGVPEFETPVFELSREMTNMDISPEDERFIELWSQSKIGGDHIHVPDPSPKNPARTGYGVEFKPDRGSPKDLSGGASYFRVTPRGAPYFLDSGQTSWVYTHYMESGYGNMRNPGKDPAGKEAQRAYFQLFIDKHQEFLDLLEEMGYKEAIVSDATRKLFGVELNQTSNEKTAYVKFTIDWNKAKKATSQNVGSLVSVESVVYPGIPELKVVELPLRTDVNPSIYYSLQGTGALEDKELAYVKFRHFDGSRPPQVYIGKHGEELTKEVDIFSKGGVSSALATADVRRQLRGKPSHPSVDHFSANPAVRDEIIKSFMDDYNIVIQKGAGLPPVSRKDILKWVNNNWSKYKQSLPSDEWENDREGKTWLWAMIAQNLQDVGIRLNERARATLNLLIKESVRRKKKMLKETRATGRGGIAKRPQYLKKFAQLVKNPDQKFKLIKGGEEVLLNMDKAQRNRVADLCTKMASLSDPVDSEEYKEVLTIFKESGIPLTQISKGIVTGKDADSGTEKEDLQIDQINKAIQAAISEESADESFDPSKGISVYLGNDRIARGVVSCKSVEKTPKSDAVLLNSAGKAVAYLSLKYASKGSEMQQWSGISAKSRLSDHAEVKAFIDDLIILTAEGRLGKAVYREISDDSLKGKAVYGPELGSRPSIENCDLCIASQSEILLVKDPDAGRQVNLFNPRDDSNLPVYTFSLSGAGSIKVRGEVPDGDVWRPVLAARYGKDRGKSQGLTHTRAGIFPIGWATNRKADEMVQANDTIVIDMDASGKQLPLPFEKNESLLRALISTILKEG